MTEHGNLTLGALPRPNFAGYTSPEQALRDARDSERRSLGLYGAQSSLGGVSEIGQITGMESLRKFYADREYDALKRKADLANDEQARQDAADLQHQKYLDAEIERQQALLQLALRQKQEFQALAVGLFDSVLHGSTSSFLKQQGQQILDKVVGNAAGMAWGSVLESDPARERPQQHSRQATGRHDVWRRPDESRHGRQHNGDHREHAMAARDRCLPHGRRWRVRLAGFRVPPAPGRD